VLVACLEELRGLEVEVEEESWVMTKKNSEYWV